MIRVQDWLMGDGLNAKLIMQVHDELVLEVRAAAREEVTEAVREQMAGAAELKVPLRIHIGVGLNWDEAH